MWGPLFEKAGVQLLICAHQHYVRFSPPVPGRSWAQLVGGGCDVVPGKEQYYPSVIQGRVADGKLVVTVHNASNGKITFEKAFS